jgi:hypothetical protein
MLTVTSFFLFTEKISVTVIYSMTAFQSLFSKFKMTEKVLGSTVEKKEKVISLNVIFSSKKQ